MARHAVPEISAFRSHSIQYNTTKKHIKTYKKNNKKKTKKIKYKKNKIQKKQNTKKTKYKKNKKNNIITKKQSDPTPMWLM